MTADARCAIYARVSTSDRQEVRGQVRQLQTYAKAQDWKAVREFIDRESGARSDRAQFRELFNAAALREFDVLLVWALDRFSREGVCDFGYIEKLRSYGVQFESLTETHFRTTGPAASC